MQTDEMRIEVYDKREQMTGSLYVVKLGDNVFRMVENDLFNCRLTFGTEFQTRINREGKHEIVKILSESNFVTRRFFLTSQFTESDYRVLGDEVIKQGGFWQVDMGSIATVNLPKNSTLDLDGMFRAFDFHPAEIKD